MFLLSSRGGSHADNPSGELRNRARHTENSPGADGLGSRTHGPRSLPDIDRTAWRVRHELPSCNNWLHRYRLIYVRSCPTYNWTELNESLKSWRFISAFCVLGNQSQSGSAVDGNLQRRDSSRRRASAHIPPKTNHLVISGGDGYEDFRLTNSSETVGRDDSTNHLLLWRVWDLKRRTSSWLFTFWCCLFWSSAQSTGLYVHNMAVGSLLD